MSVTLTDEEVRAAHGVLDRLSSSMDWDSGFLDEDDLVAFNALAEATGYPAIVAKAETKPGMRAGYYLKPLIKCESYLDTSRPAMNKGKPVDGPLEAIRLTCCLHQAHRGKHHSEAPWVAWWE